VKLLKFLKLLFVQCRVKALRLTENSWLVVYCNDVQRAIKLANEINRANGKWQGIIVASDDISVSTVREIPEEQRQRLLRVLLAAEEE
jgi:hypothetical protein